MASGAPKPGRPRKEKPGVKLIQPIQIDWELAKTLVEAKAMKAPTVPKLEGMEKWVLARGWHLSTGFDSDFGLTVATVETPGIDGPMFFYGKDATMALATAKAIGEAFRKGPKQTSFVDVEYEKSGDDHHESNGQPSLFDQTPGDEPTLVDVGAIADELRAELESETTSFADEFRKEIESDPDLGEGDLEDQLERALEHPSEHFDDMLAAVGDDDPELADAFDDPADEDQSEGESSSDTSATAGYTLGEAEPQEDWRFLFIVDPTDAALWKQTPPLDEGFGFVEFDDGEHGVDRGWYLCPTYAYDHAAGIVSFNGAEVWNRNAHFVKTWIDTPAAESTSEPAAVDAPDIRIDRDDAPRGLDDIRADLIGLGALYDQLRPMDGPAWVLPAKPELSRAERNRLSDRVAELSREYAAAKAAQDSAMTPPAGAEAIGSAKTFRNDFDALGVALVWNDGVPSLPSAPRGRPSNERRALESKFDELLRKWYGEVSIGGDDLPKAGASVSVEEILVPR